MGTSERRWRWVDDDPAYEPAFSRKPDSVEHEADLQAMTYVWTASFSNPDPWAESATSRASRHYAIKRELAGWMIRLVGRNNSTFETPHPWEPAPARLARAWDAASKGS